MVIGGAGLRPALPARYNLVSEMLTITLKPEDEDVIKKRLLDGAFRSAEEIVHRALETLDAQEAWLRQNRDAIAAKLDRAEAEFERGEGIPGEEAKKRLQLMKEARNNWRASQARGTSAAT